jgi:hypothetical protein
MIFTRNVLRDKAVTVESRQKVRLEQSIVLGTDLSGFWEEWKALSLEYYALICF